MAEFSEMDQSLELLRHIGDLSGSVMENPSLGLLCFSDDSFFPQQANFGLGLVDSMLGMMPVDAEPASTEASGIPAIVTPGCRKRKIMSESSSEPPSESVVTEEKMKKRNSWRGGKKGRGNSKQVEEQKEVVHVRARRGQATDSHSLAERVRREKINERMRRLQDLVPGCYKAMGMSGTLDEIINYVQSLQNMVEFLSMQLSAANSLYDIGMDNDSPTTPQLQIGNLHEAQEAEKLAREGYEGCLNFYTSMPF